MVSNRPRRHGCDPKFSGFDAAMSATSFHHSLMGCRPGSSPNITPRLGADGYCWGSRPFDTRSARTQSTPRRGRDECSTGPIELASASYDIPYIYMERQSGDPRENRLVAARICTLRLCALSPCRGSKERPGTEPLLRNPGRYGTLTGAPPVPYRTMLSDAAKVDLPPAELRDLAAVSVWMACLKACMRHDNQIPLGLRYGWLLDRISPRQSIFVCCQAARPNPKQTSTEPAMVRGRGTKVCIRTSVKHKWERWRCQRLRRRHTSLPEKPCRRWAQLNDRIFNDRLLIMTASIGRRTRDIFSMASGIHVQHAPCSEPVEPHRGSHQSLVGGHGRTRNAPTAMSGLRPIVPGTVPHKRCSTTCTAHRDRRPTWRVPRRMEEPHASLDPPLADMHFPKMFRRSRPFQGGNPLKVCTTSSVQQPSLCFLLFLAASRFLEVARRRQYFRCRTRGHHRFSRSRGP